MVTSRWAWVSCCAVLFAGQSHAHLHYCLDGQEPPISVHYGDGIDPGHEHEEHHGKDDGPHDDLDVDLIGADQALTKAFKLDQPVPALLAGWSIDLAAPRSGVAAGRPDLAPGSDPPHARPQARGPPA